MKRRILLNFLAGISALLATLLLCGYLVTLRFDVSVMPFSQQISLGVDLENGRLLCDAGRSIRRLSFFPPRNPGRFDFHGSLEPYFLSVEHPYWWGWNSNYWDRTGGLGRGSLVECIAPIWSIALPLAMFPLIYFGRKLRNRAGGFPVIAQVKQA